MTSLLSGRVVTTPPSELSPDRSQFLDLREAEPNLALPTGPGLLLTSDTVGTRSWVSMNELSVKLESSNISVDTSYTDPTYPVASADPTNLNELINTLDYLFNLLRPKPPLNFPGTYTLSVDGVGTMYDPKLADGGVPNNSLEAGSPAPGDSVVRTLSATQSSSIIGSQDDVGPGDNGIVSALVNGYDVGNILLNASNNSGTYGNLTISNDQDYPVDVPGFWQSFRSSITNAPVVAGLNSFQLTDTAPGTTNTNLLWFVRDTLTDTPVLTSAAIQATPSSLTRTSSGVEHFDNGSSLAISNLQMTNLSGETYAGVDPISGLVGSNISSNQSFTWADTGISTPVPRQLTSAQSINTLELALDGVNVHNIGQLQLTGVNVNGPGTTFVSTTKILAMLGQPGSRVAEQVIAGTTTSGTRTYLGASAVGNTPTLSLPTGTPSWDSSIDLSTSGYEHEASVVGGAISCDQNNYTTDYIPSNSVNYSSKPSTQWFTFGFSQPAVSSFFLNITGTYSQVLVGMPGISDNASISPLALGNTWWTASKLYSGAGVPGRIGDSDAGCAVGTAATGSSGSYKITFGSQNSTNATNNRIIIRIKLTAGQSITGLSMTN